MAIGYTEIDFINGSAPALNATNLNKIDEALKDACDLLDAETTAGRALVEAADADAQRTALGLGDSATLAVGTGAGDVAAGNAPAGAVTTHESTYVHANIPTAGGKADADAIAATAGATLAARLQTAANVAAGADVTANNAPKAHTASHKHGGTDEIATATPAPNAIPKADGSGKLDGWISDGAVGTKGKVALAADGGTTAGTVVQGNDSRLATVPGAWTPIPKFSGVADDGTKSISQNTFIKIGKKYVLDAIISWTAKGTKTGTLTLEGVPASALAVTGIPAGTAYLVNASGLVANGNIVMIIAYGTIYFKKLDTTGHIDALTDANFGNTTVLRIHLEYVAA